MSPSPRDLDATDPLGRFRKRFAFPDPELIYLDGNSLGRLPLAAADVARDTVEREWGDRLIRSWNESWLDTRARIGDKLGGLLGARPGEVAVADSTSVNLYKLAVAALRARPGRPRIVTDDLNFPSDRYILESAADGGDEGHRLDVVASPDGVHGPVDDLVAHLDDDVALLTLSHVTYTSGYRYDMARLTDAAHRVGALVLWDLSHSVGSVPIDLAGAGADLAVGCTYKYVNGGPGAPAFLYARGDLHDGLHQPVTGWWGHTRPFDFDPGYRPADGIERFLTGSPPMVSIAVMEPGIDLLLEAGMEPLRRKSVIQTGHLVHRWEQELAEHGFEMNSPTDPEYRGSHISLGHPDALGIDLALIDEFGVLPDYRPPDHLRLGVAPLYTRHRDVAAAADALVTIVTERRHHRYTGTRPTVI